MLKGYKNLYINGCSFTKGDKLKTTHAFPWKVNQLLGTELYDFAKNGNSLESIAFTSTHHLLDFDPQDTLVLIGLTWASRSGILFNKRIYNITPADFSKIKHNTSFTDKNLPGRFSLPFINPRDLPSNWREIEDQQAVDDVLKLYTEYKQTIVKYDEKFKETFNESYLFTLVNLQNFLVSKQFNYYFIDFSDVVSKETLNFKLNALVDHSRVIPMNQYLHKGFTIDSKTAHPTAEATTFLAEYIFNFLNNKL